jgi:hypothetical protein
MFESVEKELSVLAQKAKSTGCWFYCSRSDDWLTPEDFESLGKSYLIMYGQSCRTVILEYNIADPKVGLARRMRKLNEATADLEKFTERVTTYFNFVAKDKS